MRNEMLEVMARMREQLSSSGGSRFSLQRSTVHALLSKSPGGFTLLEVLVAMSILMMIVMMMATLFSQSTTAWDRGIDSARLSLKGRAIMRMMQHDLSQAVAEGGVDGDLVCEFSANSFEVCTFGEVVDGKRVLKVVGYSGGGGLSRRTETITPDETDGYGSFSADGQAQRLLDKCTFEVKVPGDDYGAYTTNLPAWVDLKLVLSEDVGESAGIEVWSVGRDDDDGTDDDISTDRND